VLFGSSDIGDFLSRVETISKIMKFDNNLMNKLKNDQQVILNQKEKLVAENNRLQTLRSSSQNTLAKLNSDVKQQKQLLANASAKEKALIAADVRAKQEAKAKADAIAAASVKKASANRVMIASSGSSRNNPSISRGTSTSTPAVAASTITVQATAYTGGGYTASGMQAAEGVIAVDPTVIPLGSRVYVDGYGYAVAADTGGAIQGNIIDLYFSSQAACQNWGRRTVTVHILK
jgi:3D (Asp-Asp-Asp) domain-containing protein